MPEIVLRNEALGDVGGVDAVGEISKTHSFQHLNGYVGAAASEAIDDQLGIFVDVLELGCARHKLGGRYIESAFDMAGGVFERFAYIDDDWLI